MRIAGLRKWWDLIRESKIFIKDKTKVACRMSGIEWRVVYCHTPSIEGMGHQWGSQVSGICSLLGAFCFIFVSDDDETGATCIDPRLRGVLSIAMTCGRRTVPVVDSNPLELQLRRRSGLYTGTLRMPCTPNTQSEVPNCRSGRITYRIWRYIVLMASILILVARFCKS